MQFHVPTQTQTIQPKQVNLFHSILQNVYVVGDFIDLNIVYVYKFTVCVCPPNVWHYN